MPSPLSIPDRRLSQVLLMISLITGIGTICGVLVSVGQLKGEITQRIADHEIRLLRHQDKLELLSDGVTDLRARIHGVASQVGRLPGKVAARMEEGVKP